MGRAASWLIVSSVIFLTPVVGFAQTSEAGLDKAAADIVAAQIRDQGYACADPVRASRDSDAAEDVVWTLNCSNASYRVRLVPDMAAHVERID